MLQLWSLLNYLPLESSKKDAELRKIQAEFLKVRKELNGTSSQDEFARWAKLRRNHDKLLEKLEASSMYSGATRPRGGLLCLFARLSPRVTRRERNIANEMILRATEKALEASKSSFDRYITGFRMLVTRVPQYGLPFWYGKEAMFWLPYGWFPYYAEWLLSFPRAPMGSVSIVSWQLACTGMIALITELIGSLVGIFTASKQPQAVPAPAKEAAAGTAGEKGKQEL